jgi:hypothetical protein
MSPESSGPKSMKLAEAGGLLLALNLNVEVPWQEGLLHVTDFVSTEQTVLFLLSLFSFHTDNHFPAGLNIKYVTCNLSLCNTSLVSNIKYKHKPGFMETTSCQNNLYKLQIHCYDIHP